MPAGARESAGPLHRNAIAAEWIFVLRPIAEQSGAQVVIGEPCRSRLCATR